MTVTLSAEVEGKVPAGFVADIVRAVLDESREPAQDPTVESTLFEARRRLASMVFGPSRSQIAWRPAGSSQVANPLDKAVHPIPAAVA